MRERKKWRLLNASDLSRPAEIKRRYLKLCSNVPRYQSLQSEVRDLNMNIFHEWSELVSTFILEHYSLIVCQQRSYLYILWKWDITKNSIVSSELVKSNLWAIPCCSGEKLDRNVTDQQTLVTLKHSMILLYHSLHKRIISVCSLSLSDTSNIVREKNEGKHQKRSIDETHGMSERVCERERVTESLQRNRVESKIWDHSCFYFAWFSFYKRWQHWRRK